MPWMVIPVSISRPYERTGLGFDEGIRESSISSHDILYVGMKEMINCDPYHVVSVITEDNPHLSSLHNFNTFFNVVRLPTNPQNFSTPTDAK